MRGNEPEAGANVALCTSLRPMASPPSITSRRLPHRRCAPLQLVIEQAGIDRRSLD